jgi:hypothetical protein
MLGKFSKKQAEPKYAKEELMAHAQALFACKSEVVAGALCDKEQADYTIDETKQIIQQFMQRKVK